jgi:hypothetical protein
MSTSRQATALFHLIALPTFWSAGLKSPSKSFQMAQFNMQFRTAACSFQARPFVPSRFKRFIQIVEKQTHAPISGA